MASTDRFCGAPGVGFGYLKPSGTGTVDTTGSMVVVAVMVVYIVVNVVSEEQDLALGTQRRIELTYRLLYLAPSLWTSP